MSESRPVIVARPPSVGFVPAPVTVPPLEFTTTVPVLEAKALIRVFSASRAVVSAPVAVPPSCTAISRRRCKLAVICCM